MSLTFEIRGSVAPRDIDRFDELVLKKEIEVMKVCQPGGSLEFYDRTRAGEESSSNLRALEGKRQCFSIFYYVNMSTKSKTESEFSRVYFSEIP